MSQGSQKDDEADTDSSAEKLVEDIPVILLDDDTPQEKQSRQFGIDTKKLAKNLSLGFDTPIKKEPGAAYICGNSDVDAGTPSAAYIGGSLNVATDTPLSMNSCSMEQDNTPPLILTRKRNVADAEGVDIDPVGPPPCSTKKMPRKPNKAKLNE